MDIAEAHYILTVVAKRKEIKRVFGELFEFGPECYSKRISRQVVHEMVARELGEVVNNDFVNNLKAVLSGYLIRSTASKGKQYYSDLRVRRLKDRQEMQESHAIHDPTVRDQVPFESEPYIHPNIKKQIADLNNQRHNKGETDE